MSIESDIANVSKKLSQLARGLKKEIQENKKLKKKASRFALEVMRAKVPTGRGPNYSSGSAASLLSNRKNKPIAGSLKASIQFLNLRKSEDVFFGPNAKKAPHGHLVEFGFKHYKSGKFVNGIHYCKRTYEETKETILKNLVAEAKKEFEKQGEELSI